MKPRNLTRFIAGAIAAASVGLLLAGGVTAPAYAKDKMVIKISDPASPSDWHVGMLYIFKEWLERSAPDEFDVQIYPNSTLYKQGAEPAAMQRGNLEMALISTQKIAKELPRYSIFTAGYLFRDWQHLLQVFDGEIGNEYFADVAKEMDIVPLATAYRGTRQVGLRKAIGVKTPADLKGVILRMPGSDDWQFLGKALGGNPTPLAFTEVYTALQTGTIDGQDNPLPTDKAAGFWEHTKEIVRTNHYVEPIFFCVSKIAWDKLTPAQKEKMTSAARIAVQFNNENVLRQEGDLVDFLQGERNHDHRSRPRRLPHPCAEDVPGIRLFEDLAQGTARSHQCRRQMIG